jgi:hypothetical protein
LFQHHRSIVAFCLGLLSLTACAHQAAQSDMTKSGTGEGAASVSKILALKIAYWTPSEGLMAAQTTGRLAIRSGCLVLEAGRAHLLVLPKGQFEWTQSTQHLTFGNRLYRVGDTISLAGGSVSKDLARWLGRRPSNIPECGLSYYFLASPS